MAVVADPEENAIALAPPASNAANVASRAWRLGLSEREYSKPCVVLGDITSTRDQTYLVVSDSVLLVGRAEGYRRDDCTSLGIGFRTDMDGKCAKAIDMGGLSLDRVTAVDNAGCIVGDRHRDGTGVRRGRSDLELHYRLNGGFIPSKSGGARWRIHPADKSTCQQLTNRESSHIISSKVPPFETDSTGTEKKTDVGHAVITTNLEAA